MNQKLTGVIYLCQSYVDLALIFGFKPSVVSVAKSYKTWAKLLWATLVSSAVNRKYEATDKEVFCVTSSRVFGSDNSHLVDIDTLCFLSLFVLVCRLTMYQELTGT